jgi:hypothetical protein
MWEPSDPEVFTSDAHLEQMKRIDALRDHYGYISKHVVSPVMQMHNQVLRGGRLWIDGCYAAEHSKLRARNITAVCALGDPDACYPEPMEGVAYFNITLGDYHYENIKAHFESATTFIHEHILKNGGRVLVHCAAGVSRSSTICIAYLMRYHQLSFAAAYAVVLEARCIIDPNPGFVAQLKEWENELTFQ